ncbi:hypothetical protein VOLCADRAFT_127324, partial [Volvox carteri f. nagariensis]
MSYAAPVYDPSDGLLQQGDILSYDCCPPAPLACRSTSKEGSYNTSLTRSQEGRRQRRARRKASFESPRWSPSEPAASRSEWLQGAKEQRTEVLLAGLLDPDSIPLARLPVLLTLVEGRSDLEDCVIAAGLPAVAAAVLRSDMLLRLLPGGTFLELLMDLGLVALQWWLEWRGDGVELTGGADFGGLDGFGLAGAAKAAALGAAASSAQGTKEKELEGVRAAVAALLHSVDIGAAAEPSTLLIVLDAAVQYGVDVPSYFVQAAARMAAASAVLSPPSSSSHSSSSSVHSAASDPGQLAARLVAHAFSSTTTTTTTTTITTAASTGGADAGAGASGGSSTYLTAAEVRGLMTPYLAPHRGEAHHVAFLSALMTALRQLLKQRRGIATAAAAAGVTPREAAIEAADGLVEALAAAAGHLGPAPLALAMECAADAAALLAEAPLADAAALGSGAAGGDAVRRLLAAAAALADQRQPSAAAAAGGGCPPDGLCRLAAAAVRLQRRGVFGSAAAADVSKLLAAVQATSLQEVSIDAAAALVAVAARAAFTSTVAEGTAAASGEEGVLSEAASEGRDGEVTIALGLPEPLLEALLRRLASEAEAEAAPATATTSRTVVRRLGDRISPADSPPPQLTPPPPAPSLSYDQAMGVLAAVVAAAEAAAEATPSTSSSSAAAPAVPCIPAERAAMLRAAGIVACRALTPAVRELDSARAIRLLKLIGRAANFGVRPDFPPLLWALHERLRALAGASALDPPDVLDVLSGCVSLRWRPALLLRELLLPLLRWLQHAEDAAAAAAAAAGGAAAAAPRVEESAAAPGARVGVGMEETAEGEGEGGRGAGPLGARSWTPRELKVCLALLGKLRYSGPIAAAVVKLGVGQLLRAAEAEAAAAGGGSGSGGGGSLAAQGAELSASDLAMLLWVCVAMRYRGATVLRPLLQLLLLAPPSTVPVKAAAQAVWAAGEDKLEAAAPQSLALLCWGLAKLGVRPPRAFVNAAMAASRRQLPHFKAQELATLLFVLATWGGKLKGDDDAVSVVQHVVATRARYDGPALCTTVWALQQLTQPASALQTGAGGTPVTDDDDHDHEHDHATAAAAAAAALSATALRALENRLLAVDIAAGPRIGFPDHHLLRFCSAAAAAGYQPKRLLNRYTTRLRLRLRTMRGLSPDVAPTEAERRSRMLWSAARIMATFDLRDSELLTLLELCAERCQSLLRPGHLAGLVNAMAALDHYPAHWARHGLLRRMGLALRRSTLTEAAATDSRSSAASPQATPRSGGVAAAAGISLDDAMRLLTALARLRWQCPPVEALLVRVASRLPLERRSRVPQLTTLMWALASLRQDTPELLEDLQAALLGLPPQPSLASEMSLLESGRAASVRVAHSSSGSGRDVAANAAAATDLQLLSRPAKPVLPAAAAEPAAAAASQGAAGFDPAAAMVAAAAEANQRLEQQLDGPAGRFQLPSEPWAPADIFKTLWACAKLNRHPGPLILAAAERSWLQYTAGGGPTAAAAAAAPSSSSSPPPLHTVTGLLWSLSVFRHHNGSFAQRLSQQLGAWLREGGTLSTASAGASAAHAATGAATRAVAACLLAAQADRVDSPLNAALPPEVRARLVAAWRYQAELVSVLRKMGLTAAANVATPDGCALVDVAVALRQPAPPAAAAGGSPASPLPPLPPPRLLALELIGRHNTAANSPRILGEAVIKYRLLQVGGCLSG